MLIQDIAVLINEGDIVNATVTSVQEFGCLVAINRAQTAILHISELSHDPMLLKHSMEEMHTVGQRFTVKVCDDDHDHDHDGDDDDVVDDDVDDVDDDDDDDDNDDSDDEDDDNDHDQDVGDDHDHDVGEDDDNNLFILLYIN